MEAIRLIVEYQQRPAPEVCRVSAADRARLASLASYINDHYAGDIPQRQMAKIACMGSTKLKASFRQVYGCTITEYVQQRRMAQAEQLLTRTELPIGQIANAVGYSSASRFSALFAAEDIQRRPHIIEQSENACLQVHFHSDVYE